MTDLNSEPIYIFIFQGHSMFVHLKYLYPECFVLLDKYQNLQALHCLVENTCPANKGCMDVLAKRVLYLFEEVWPKLRPSPPENRQIVSYYKHRTPSIKGALFQRSMGEPRRITINPFAFKKFRKESEIYKWYPTDEYSHMAGSSGIVSVDNLIK